jgi:hypothetical protein
MCSEHVWLTVWLAQQALLTNVESNPTIEYKNRNKIWKVLKNLVWCSCYATIAVVRCRIGVCLSAYMLLIYHVYVCHGYLMFVIFEYMFTLIDCLTNNKILPI